MASKPVFCCHLFCVYFLTLRCHSFVNLVVAVKRTFPSSLLLHWSVDVKGFPAQVGWLILNYKDSKMVRIFHPCRLLHTHTHTPTHTHTHTHTLLWRLSLQLRYLATKERLQMCLEPLWLQWDAHVCLRRQHLASGEEMNCHYQWPWREILNQESLFTMGSSFVGNTPNLLFQRVRKVMTFLAEAHREVWHMGE